MKEHNKKMTYIKKYVTRSSSSTITVEQEQKIDG